MSARPVLLVDSDKEWCARVCRYLELHGIEVVTAASVGSVARTVDQVGEPSAVVMDLAERIASADAVAALRADGLLRDVPVAYVNKAAALDALLLLVAAPARGEPQRAAVGNY